MSNDDGYSWWISYRNKRLFLDGTHDTFVASSKEELLQRYKEALEALHAGEFDELIKNSIPPKKAKTTTQEPDPK